jgi:hypothetical protein
VNLGGMTNDLAFPTFDRIFPARRSAPIESASSAAGQTIATHEADPGTGLHVFTPGELPSVTGIFSGAEQAVMQGSSVSNAGAWVQDAAAAGPSANVLQSIAQAGSSGGVNLQLGPQADFAPVDTSSTTSSGGGGGVGGILFVGIAIVGVLVYLHFRKKHAAEAAKA